MRCSDAVQDHAIGRALRARAAAVILGQGHCKTLFIHAGLSPQMLQTLVEHSQASQSPTALLKTLNNLVTGESQSFLLSSMPCHVTPIIGKSLVMNQISCCPYACATSHVVDAQWSNHLTFDLLTVDCSCETVLCLSCLRIASNIYRFYQGP